MTYGYRRITEGIRIKYGVIFNNKKVQRIMNKYYLKPKYIKRIILNNYKRIEENVNSNVFIEFMLKMIDETLDEAISTSHMPLTNETININRLLNVMETGKPITATEIMEKLGIKSKETLRGQYLDPAIKQGLINLTIPDKPTSKNQMYYKN